MIRLALSLTLVATMPLALPAAAQGVFVGPPPGIGTQAAPLTGKRGRIDRELRKLGVPANVSRLSNQQIALIDTALHQSRSNGDTQSRVRSILRGGGALQRVIDRN